MSRSEPTMSVGRLWRYPVKSMLGEEVAELQLGPSGVLGDRAYGFVDVQTGKLVSAKRAKSFGALLNCRARFLSAATEDRPSPPIAVRFPDGSSVRDDDAELARRTSELLGREVRLVATASAGTGLTAPGAMLDLAGLHLLEAGTLRRLAAEYPAGDWDPRRMRPNVLVVGEESAGEQQWLRGDLHIGAEALARVVGPTPRCVMTTLAAPGLRHDPDILRTITAVSGELPCAGWYADVDRPGVIRTGDPIRFGET
ncbi:MAG: MOSC N-terminal beta barrel domain-containing protein [Mycobacterium sp.]